MSGGEVHPQCQTIGYFLVMGKINYRTVILTLLNYNFHRKSLKYCKIKSNHRGGEYKEWE